jgi:hypothetical protein
MYMEPVSYLLINQGLYPSSPHMLDIFVQSPLTVSKANVVERSMWQHQQFHLAQD